MELSKSRRRRGGEGEEGEKDDDEEKREEEELEEREKDEEGEETVEQKQDDKEGGGGGATGIVELRGTGNIPIFTFCSSTLPAVVFVGQLFRSELHENETSNLWLQHDLQGNNKRGRRV